MEGALTNDHAHVLQFLEPLAGILLIKKKLPSGSDVLPGDIVMERPFGRYRWLPPGRGSIGSVGSTVHLFLLVILFLFIVVILFLRGLALAVDTAKAHPELLAVIKYYIHHPILCLGIEIHMIDLAREVLIIGKFTDDAIPWGEPS
jgi:hypothetical protein